MNNEKLILRSLNFLLLKSQTFSEKEANEKREILGEVDKLLNPKEVVPYEDSLKKSQRICANCNYFESVHGDPKFFDKKNVCDNFKEKDGGS